jgi:hypothetical protein
MRQSVQEFLGQMDRDMEKFERERVARQKAAPLARSIREGFRSFPGVRPSRLRVSSLIYSEFIAVLGSRMEFEERMYEVLFMGCPVEEVPELDGFLWV